MADLKRVKTDPKPVITDSTPVDIKEYVNKYVYIMDVPGAHSAAAFGDSCIKVQVEDTNVLTIRATRKVNEEIGVIKYIQMQRKIQNVINSKFRLPFDANPHGVSACVFSGVLVITVLKFVRVETNKPQVVKVKTDFDGKFS
ncbi:hypothetical protein MKW92_047065 [Papaver armeniacum]|nr:hypothetical protein MKW92_047065 [Papaver armeniacum]